MADIPCTYEKWIRERFSESLRPSACQHHRSFLCIAARLLAMAWSFSASFAKLLIAAGGLLAGKLLRATCLVKRETSITGELWTAFTAAGAASTLAEIANFSRAQSKQLPGAEVRTCENGCQRSAIMSACGVRPEVSCTRSKRREWPKTDFAKVMWRN